MFKELFALIPEKGSVRFAVTRTGPDSMAVVLVPEFPAGTEAPKLTPLSVSGPVDELEAGFLEAVLAYQPDVAKLENNLAQARASMEAKKEGKGKAEAKQGGKPEPKPEKPASSQVSILDLAQPGGSGDTDPDADSDAEQEG